MKSFEQKKVIDTQGGHVYSLVISSDYIIAGTYENCIHVSVFIQCVNVFFAQNSNPGFVYHL